VSRRTELVPNCVTPYKIGANSIRTDHCKAASNTQYHTLQAIGSVYHLECDVAKWRPGGLNSITQKQNSFRHFNLRCINNFPLLITALPATISLFHVVTISFMPNGLRSQFLSVPNWIMFNNIRWSTELLIGTCCECSFSLATRLSGHSVKLYSKFNFSIYPN
jgi:hypothetical protein